MWYFYYCRCFKQCFLFMFCLFSVWHRLSSINTILVANNTIPINCHAELIHHARSRWLIDNICFTYFDKAIVAQIVPIILNLIIAKTKVYLYKVFSELNYIKFILSVCISFASLETKIVWFHIFGPSIGFTVFWNGRLVL